MLFYVAFFVGVTSVLKTVSLVCKTNFNHKNKFICFFNTVDIKQIDIDFGRVLKISIVGFQGVCATLASLWSILKPSKGSWLFSDEKLSSVHIFN